MKESKAPSTNLLFVLTVLLAFGIGPLSGCMKGEPDSESPVSHPASAPVLDNAFASGEIDMSFQATISDKIFTDTRDAEKYGTIKIGDQVWMTENLRHKGPGSYSANDDAANDTTYGRLYEWANVPANIPDGWHLPSDDEWKTLERQLGMSEEDLRIDAYNTPRGTDQGTQLKEGGSSGLNFALAGFRNGSSFQAFGHRTYLWNRTVADNGEIYRRRLVVDDASCYRFTNPPGSFAVSVRLVRD